MEYAHKKSVVPFAFIGIPRSSTTYTYPIITSNSTLEARLGRFYLGTYSRVVEVREYQISYFAFSYSMMCISFYALCFIGSCFS